MREPKQTGNAREMLKTINAKSMEIQTSTDHIDRYFRNQEIKAQSEKWDAEAHFIEFEQALDTLDLISDALPDDPKIANALNGLHGNFNKIYQESKLRLFL